MKTIEKIEEIILDCEKTRKKAHEDSNYKLRDFLYFHILDLEKLKNVFKLKSKEYSKKDMLDFYNFIKEECDVKNCAGYADFHFNLFLKKRSLKRKS